jgi:hypothetical protein
MGCKSHCILKKKKTSNYWVFGLFPQSCILKTERNTTFWKLDLFPSSGEGWETLILQGTLVRANLHHWTTSVSITTATWIPEITLLQWEITGKCAMEIVIKLSQTSYSILFSCLWKLYHSFYCILFSFSPSYKVLPQVLIAIIILTAGHSSRAVWSMNRLRSLEHWDRGFESHSRHGCMCTFILCMLLRVGSGLATGWSPVQRVLQTAYRIKKLKKRPRSNRGL